MKNVFIFLCCFMALTLCYSCDSKEDDVNDEINNPVIPDPEGTVALDMSVSTERIDRIIYLEEGNFKGALFTTLGKVRGLSDVITIPKKGWVSKVAVIEGHGYIAYYNNQYWRLFVSTYNSSSSRAIIKYQRPFIGSEKEIKPQISIVTVDNSSDYQTVEFTNESLFPYTVNVPQSVNWCTAYSTSTDSNTPNNIIKIAANEKNPTLESRECIITVKSDIGKDATIKVVQAGGESWITPVDNQVYLYQTNSQEVKIMSNAQWTATSNVDWCTVSPNAGNKEGNITISATVNATGAARNAIITLITKDNKAKAEINVVQSASSLSLSRNSISFTAVASQNTFAVNSVNKSWKVTSDKDWCTVTAKDNMVTVSVTENLTGVDRSAVVTVALSEELKATVNVTQVKPTLSVSKSDIAIAGIQSQSYFTVSSNVSSWSVVSNQNWCTVEVNNNTVNITATANLTGTERNAIITVSISGSQSLSVTVKQALPILTTSKADISFEGKASTGSFTVNSSISNWTVSSNQGWCQATTNGNTVNISVANNLTGSERKAVVTVSIGNNQHVGVTVTQAAATLSTSKTSISLAGNQSGDSFTITSNISPWTVSSNQNWCSIVINNNQVTVSATENLTGAERSATIKVAISEQHYKTITVTQAMPTLSISMAEYKYPIGTNTGSISITSNVSAWNISSNQNWCVVSKSGNNNISVLVYSNETGQNREALITVSLPNDIKTIKIYQGGYKLWSAYSRDGVEGIIYKIDGVNMHGMIMSMDEAEVEWSKLMVATYARDTENGLNNMNAIKSLSNWQENYPAFAWCEAKNVNGITGWYIPASNEIASVVVLQLSSYSNKNYWTSTENSEAHAFWFNPSQQSKTAAQKNYYHSVYVRAIKSF